MATAYLGEQVVPYFDEAYYLRQFPDVAAAVAGGVFASGWEHFRMFGVAEGRVASPLVDLDVYRANNPDLADAGLTSDASLVLHFYVYGRNESRAFVNESVFDWEYYLEKNPDLAAAGISTREAAENHFLNYGINEGRIVHPNIEGASYIDKHPDLAAYVGGGGTLAGLTDKAAIGIWHYLNYGFAEGRELGNPQPGDPVPVPPAPPVDDDPVVTFTVSAVGEVGEQVVTFGGNATGTITMTANYVSGDSPYLELVFSRQSITANAKPSVSDVASISLEDGVLLSSTAEVANLLRFSAVGDNKTGRVSIAGSNGDQTLYGAEGNDTITGGEGADSINGGAGADTIVLTETTSARDTVTFADLATTDAITDFNATAGDATEDLLVFDLSEIESGGDAVYLDDAASLSNADATPLFATITGATDLASVAANSNILIADLAGNIANAEALETALEEGGGLALTVNNLWAAGDTFLVALDDGAHTYIAKVVVGGDGAANDGTFATGELTATVLVTLTGTTVHAPATVVVAGANYS